MAMHDRQNRFFNKPSNAHLGGNALIVHQNSFRCAAKQCDSLATFLHDSLTFGHIQETLISGLPDTIPFVPDVVFVRLSDDRGAQNAIRSSTLRWPRASVLAVFCPGLEPPTIKALSFLSSADDFVSCPFQKTELLFRVYASSDVKQGDTRSNRR